MNQTTYRMRRRVGAALLAGVSALGVTGVAALAGEGVANAATPTVTATATANQTISGTATAVSAGGLNLSVSGTITANDRIVLTIACPSSGSVAWDTSMNGAVGSTGWTAAVGNSAGSGGTDCFSQNNQLVLTAGSSSASTTIAFTPSLDTVGAPPGAVSISGAYQTYGSSTSFSVPTIATVNWFTVTANVPSVTTTGTSTTSISNITISQPSGLTTGLTNNATAISNNSHVYLTLTGATFSAQPTFTAVPSSALTGTASVAYTAGSNAVTATATTGTSISGANFTFSNLSITPTGAAGPITATITFNSTSNLGTNTGTITRTVTVATEIGASTRYYGQTADQTVATEFQAAFPISSGGVRTAVIATDKDPYDALAASYLAGQLGTGVLIVPQSGFTGSAAAQALQIEGVTSVYIVGGPLAVPSNVTSQITSTPAYNVGGVTQTGSNLTIAAQIYGNTADDTAQMIATHFGTAFGSLPSLSAAYNTTGGVYNDTAGNASTTAPSGTVPTAFMISDTDWRDATTLGPIAYAYRIPILLTQANYSSSTIGNQAQSALTSLGIKQVIVVGGQLAFPNSWVTSMQSMNGGTSVLRIAGLDYTDTAVQLAKFETGVLGWQGGANKGFLLSHGDYWADALGAAAMAGNANFSIGGTTYGYEPILTTENPTTIGQYLQGYISSIAPSSAALNVLGGPLAVTSSVVTSLQSSLAS